MTYKVILTLGILFQGLYYATTYPGEMDTFNGILGGFMIYSLWEA